jgi:putative membrane protein
MFREYSTRNKSVIKVVMKLNPIWDLFFATTLLAVGSWYFLEKPARLGISKLRQAFFYLALFLSTIVLVGPIPHLAVRIFWVHMVQHILLMMLISPLIILSSPIKVALNSHHSRFRLLVRRIAAVSLIRSIFRPQVGFVIFLVTLIATHFSPLADAGMVNSNVHSLELILFLIAGLIYYYPVLEGNPTPFPVSHATRLGSLFAMMLPETMTGFFLYSGNKLLHSVSMDMSGPANRLNPLRDQHTGGALMWAMGMLIDSMWVVLAARDWFANEKRMAELDDLENAKLIDAIE